MHTMLFLPIRELLRLRLVCKAACAFFDLMREKIFVDALTHFLPLLKIHWPLVSASAEGSEDGSMQPLYTRPSGTWTPSQYYQSVFNACIRVFGTRELKNNHNMAARSGVGFLRDLIGSGVRLKPRLLVCSSSPRTVGCGQLTMTCPACLVENGSRPVV
jgi:hypothetical protein